PLAATRVDPGARLASGMRPLRNTAIWAIVALLKGYVKIRALVRTSRHEAWDEEFLAERLTTSVAERESELLARVAGSLYKTDGCIEVPGRPGSTGDLSLYGQRVQTSTVFQTPLPALSIIYIYMYPSPGLQVGDSEA
ncbi:unnamed protein product, partial [Prorocentrum cordatum]